MVIKLVASDLDGTLLQNGAQALTPEALRLIGKLLERGILARSCANYHGLGPQWLRLAVKRHEENRALISALTDIGKEG